MNYSCDNENFLIEGNIVEYMQTYNVVNGDELKEDLGLSTIPVGVGIKNKRKIPTGEAPRVTIFDVEFVPPLKQGNTLMTEKKVNELIEKRIIEKRN